jgi:hypothetical protein
LKQSFSLVEPSNLSLDFGLQLTDSPIRVRTTSPMPKQFSELAPERFLNTSKPFDFEAFVLERIKDPKSHPSHLAADDLLNLRLRCRFDPFPSTQLILKCPIYEFGRSRLELGFNDCVG